MSNSKRYVGVLTALIFISPLVASAQTTDVSSQVQSLLSQISMLQQQLQTLLASQHSSSTPDQSGWQVSGSSTMPVPPMWGNASSTIQRPLPPQASACASFSRDLSVGSSGEDVTSLQDMLEQQGLLQASSTGFFGPLTEHALALFQMQNGVATSSAGGFFGPLTRGILSRRCGEDTGSQGNGAFRPEDNTMPPAWVGSSTGPLHIQWGAGSTTQPQENQQPCDNVSQDGAAALFVPHTFGPGMMRPCGDGQQSAQGGAQSGGDWGGVQQHPMIPAPMTQTPGGDN